MFRNRLYYRLKPLLPASLRLAVRRWFAVRKREQVLGTWPILPGSEKPPANWPGWPDGKQFAFVLTHDVEGPGGLAKCRQLMELEMKLGFRSSFNFIPEGDYTVPRSLIDELKANGFEVGVHDLYHDGRLYRSRKDFSRHAQKINQYLKDWGAVGFRSGSMFHNLEWLHDLEVAYDASTFDTDPFEPQPDGVSTIFPFWVTFPRDLNPDRDPDLDLDPERARSRARSRRGYVELPYTLPQDSTLFLLMSERHPDIWFQKLDWIARHGGMALLNVHPDYIDLDESGRRGRYPKERYLDFLNYVSDRYKGRFWHSTPTQLAGWFRSLVPEEQRSPRPEHKTSPLPERANDHHLSGKRAAVVLYSYYATDPRPRREAEALIRAGMEVDVICLRRAASLPMHAVVDGANVFRVPLKRRRSTKLTYALQYAWFVLASFLVLSFRTLRKRYDLVHVHNMPDFLVFSAILPRLRGAKIILDLHDPMPELFRGIYGFSEKHFIVRWLKKMEKLSIAFAHRVLTPNLAFKELFTSRSCRSDKLHIVMNSPKERIFSCGLYTKNLRQPANGRQFRIMYHGLLVERHGLDLAVQAVAQLRSRIPQLSLDLYGEQTDYMEGILQLVQKLGLEDVVHYHGFKPLEEIAEAIAGIDLGLIPNRSNPFTQINLPTRIFEYLAMEKPVIVPRTKGIQDYFPENDILYFAPGDMEELAAKIEWVYSHREAAQAVVFRGRRVYNQHKWEVEEGRFLSIVEAVLAKEATRKPAALASSGKRVCMISYSHYESDNRVLRYAEELGKRGDIVDVLALKRDHRQPRTETIGRTQVVRIQTRSHKKEKNKAAFLLPLLRFWALASGCLTWRHLKRRYDLIHVHNVPDFLVFAAWLPKLTGAKIILDIHDIVPEFYGSKFKVPENSATITMLKAIERASARFADRVIISNHLWLDKYALRTGANGKCSVFINNVNSSIFQPRAGRRNDGKIIILFPGGLQWHQGLDIAIRAFQKVSCEVPDAEFQIYGDGNMKESLVALSRELGLEDKVRFFDPLSVHQIAEIMANADLGVVPKRADSFGNEAYSTKIMEFMSLGVPVVVSSTKIDRYYFNDSVVRFFESGNPDAMASAMLDVIRDPNLSRSLVANGFEYAARNSWESRKGDYLNLVDSLIRGKQWTDEKSDRTDNLGPGSHTSEVKENPELKREKLMLTADNAD